MLIYKILTAADRESLETNETFAGAPVDRADGYIHFSTADQLPGTLAKHFQTDADLWIAAVNADRLGAALKWEAARGGALFPHLYAPMTRAMVDWISPTPLAANGARLLPDLSTGAPGAAAKG